MKQSKKLIFFGSGPVAAASLRRLTPDFSFEAVITKPRPPRHRGPVPVLELAQQLKLPVYTAANKTGLDELFDSRKFESKAAILIDFGIIISQKVIDSFPLGIINSHFSILPEWRGADPITFAVLSGQKQTGVSLMLLVEKMDEGPLLAYARCDMPAGITTPRLTDVLIKLSHVLLVSTLPKYFNGQLQPFPQTVTKHEVSYSRKLVKEDGVIDFKKPVKVLEREVRAYAGWPKSQAKIFGYDVIITKARVASGQNDGDLVMQCGARLPAGRQGWLEILQLKAPSGRTMSGKDFLHGYKK
ncbi:methionyl-tRNA formyltransferase [Candidatus Saccharibacteria bacterium]|nr:methionyl-tRNA formyltransferase [Candidatus Saccharibacteria bacterium]